MYLLYTLLEYQGNTLKVLSDFWGPLLLSFARLKEAKLTNVYLINVDSTDACLIDANLSGTDL